MITHESVPFGAFASGRARCSRAFIVACGDDASASLFGVGAHNAADGDIARAWVLNRDDATRPHSVTTGLGCQRGAQTALGISGGRTSRRRLLQSDMRVEETLDNVPAATRPLQPNSGAAATSMRRSTAVLTSLTA